MNEWLRCSLSSLICSLGGSEGIYFPVRITVLNFVFPLMFGCLHGRSDCVLSDSALVFTVGVVNASLNAYTHWIVLMGHYYIRTQISVI